MNAIEFNDAELSEMKRFYLAQLAEAEGKVAHIKGVLAKLGAPVVASAVQAASLVDAPVAGAVATEEESTVEEVPSGEARKAYVSYIPVEYTKRGRSATRKRERKSKWATYIANTLRNKGDFMTVNEIIEQAMKRTANQEAGEQSVRGGVTGSLNRLSKEYFRLRTLQVEGRRGRYYGLSVWFNKDGSLKSGFGERFGPLNITVKAATDTSSDED